ncbi:hypothetical protein RvY_11958-2 [Ramazzottius varieornatus]|uniref:Cation/H+ exchanger domain-containing protein n=1 Tax=Ramazzottius varieornatus TaxID=947166 RepID=A0A1D1VHV5_RAMVA|nr:hypothetical protein RvY_11958-2 [Ramazzottius varieornatus]
MATKSEFVGKSQPIVRDGDGSHSTRITSNGSPKSSLKEAIEMGRLDDRKDSREDISHGQVSSTEYTNGHASTGPGMSSPQTTRLAFIRRLQNAVLAKNSTVPPAAASRWQRIKYTLLCPPHGKLAYNLTKVLVVTLLFLTFVAMLGDEARPGGNFWGLLLVTICACVGEQIAKTIRLPGLLGMLVAGFLLQNVPGIRVAAAIRPAWSSALRSIALVIILIRGGLGLDIIVLKKLSRGVALLAFLPSTVESVVVGVVAHFLLHFDWLWAFVLGYLLTAVSPAVLVPNMLHLQEIGLGVERGVPTLLVAASSVENVYAIQVFSVLLSVGFSTSTAYVARR